MFVFDNNITAKVMFNCITKHDSRIFSAIVVIPRIILAELNTHKMLAKNSASSRAIPSKKMHRALEETPFEPSGFQKQHSGMQGVDYIIDLDASISDIPYTDASIEWSAAKNTAVKHSLNMDTIGVTKQITNRLLEPFLYHTVLISGSKEGWENFFKLRCPQYQLSAAAPVFRSKKDLLEYTIADDTDYNEYLLSQDDLWWAQHNKGLAEIHIMQVAEKLWDLYTETPTYVKEGTWIIPYEWKLDRDQLFRETEFTGIDEDKRQFMIKSFIKIATSMAARTSYTTIGDEKEITYTRLMQIYDEMLVAQPPHQSPQEQLYRSMNETEFFRYHRQYTICGPIPEYMKSDILSGITTVDSILDYDNQEAYVVREYGWCKHVRGFIPLRHFIEAGLPIL